MISVSNHSLGYKVTVSYPDKGVRPHWAFARTVAEIHEAIDHYFALPPHVQDKEGCPLCRLRRKEK